MFVAIFRFVHVHALLIVLKTFLAVPPDVAQCKLHLVCHSI